MRKSIYSGLNGLRIFVVLFLLPFMTQGISAQGITYKDYEKMTTELRKLEKKNNIVTQLESIGKTIEGRDIWLFTVGNPAGVALDMRPAILVSANLEADHLAGSELVLGMIDEMVSGYGKNAEITNALDEYVFYFLPRVNPDGAEAFWADVKSGGKANCSAYDGDNDGRMDEDGPEDLNGDGYITMMRVKDPTGLYCIDADNPDLLKKADPTKGEQGTFKVFWEGLDNDGDGFINEDPKGGVDINRNFAHEYPYYQSDAGIHMVSENETRAVMDWIIQQRNIAVMLTFSQSDNLLTPPNSKGQLSNKRSLSLVDFANASIKDAGKVGMVSTMPSGFGRYYGMGMNYSRSGGASQQASASSRRGGRKAATAYNTADLVYYNKISKQYKELTGISKAPVLREPKGAMSEYGYFQYGVLSLTTPGWGFKIADDTEKADEADKDEVRGEQPQRRGAGTAGRGLAPGMMSRGSASGASSGTDAELYKYLEETGNKGFVKWESYTHPELGEVEIGGFTPFEIVNPEPGIIANQVKKHTDFILYLSSLHAKVKIAKTKVEDHGDGLFTIKATIQNTGFLPTSLQHGVVSRAVAPTMVQLDINSENIISGNSKTNFFQKLDGSGNTESFEWLVRGKKGEELDLKLKSQKAGYDKVTIKLQ